jgi:ubiquinone/menaquinone biosynthesis C-methylase UbiE
MEERKAKEKELHDHLRGDWVDDPRYTSNKKFYSISKSNRDYVKVWLAERCKGKRVLDYCCGSGEFTIWLAEIGAEAFGIDISPVSIENARKEADKRGISDRAHFLVMDAEAMEFDNDYFDYAVVNGVLHHLDLRRAYPELARVLVSSGEVICTEPLKYNPVFQLYRRMTPHLRTSWEIKHILGKSDIQMARAYFHDVSIAKFFHLATIAAVPFRNRNLFQPTLRILEAIDSVLLRLPFIKWWAWMVVFVLARPKK